MQILRNALPEWTVTLLAVPVENQKSAICAEGDSTGDSIHTRLYFTTDEVNSPTFERIVPMIQRGLQVLKDGRTDAVVLIAGNQGNVPIPTTPESVSWLPLSCSPHFGAGLIIRLNGNANEVNWFGGGRKSPGAENLGWIHILEVLRLNGNVQTLDCRSETDDAFPLVQPPALSANRPRTYSREVIHYLDEHLTSLCQSVVRTKSYHCESALAAMSSGVWLFHGEWDRAHRLAQQFEGEGDFQLCDYWHAILHRQEPDYGNAKYWFRQLGRHILYPELAKLSCSIFETHSAAGRDWSERVNPPAGWNAAAFVDLVQSANSNPGLEQLAEQLQWLEMCLLMRLTVKVARGDL